MYLQVLMQEMIKCKSIYSSNGYMQIREACYMRMRTTSCYRFITDLNEEEYGICETQRLTFQSRARTARTARPIPCCSRS